MLSAGADRNLLFGILALQMGFVSRDGLIAVMETWALNKDRSLGEILVVDAALSEQDRLALEQLVESRLARHEHDPVRTLAALPLSPELAHTLDHLSNPDFRASLFRLGPNSPVTLNVRPRSTARAEGATPTLPRYRVVKLHARGGLGEVSVAVDEQLNREVALKQIQDQYADDIDSQARFLREAEITGRLEHPGIVPVYGMDTDEAGRPRSAMRFIRGVSMEEAINQFHEADRGHRPLNERMLALRGLLRRFLDACNAVAYAHSRGVIHRDIKPANIMLGDFGETLVVDWGLARVLDPQFPHPPTPSPKEGEGEKEDPAAEESPRSRCAKQGRAEGPTQAGQIVGTLAFMSPEQARGEQDRVGKASDVFALGATLYCLLTGQPPYFGNYTEVIDRVRRGEVLPARQVNPRVPAALEAVCRTAMAARMWNRYASVGELAGEVERWLADEPVQVHRESLPAKLLRWSRRHRTLVAVALVLLLASVVGLGLGLAAVRREQAETALQRDQATENLAAAEKAEEEAKSQLARAEENMKLARLAVDECFGIARDHPLLQADNLQKVRKLLLEKTLPFYERFGEQKSEETAIAARQAEYLYRVAFITAEIDRKAKALATYQKARDVLLRLSKAHPDVPLHELNLANSWNGLGSLQNATGKPKDALHSYTQAREILRKLTTAHPEDVHYRDALGITWNNLAILHSDMGNQALSLDSYQQARDIQATLAKAHPGESRYKLVLARTCNNLGNLQREMGKRRSAVENLQTARDLQLALSKAHPQTARYRGELANTCRNLGNLQREMGRAGAARASLEQARDYLLALCKTHPEVVVYRSDLAHVWINLGTLQRESNHPREAQASCEKARDLFLELNKANPEVTAYRAGLAGAWNQLGVLQQQGGKIAEAVASYEQASDLQAALSKTHPEIMNYRIDLAGTCCNLANLLVRREQFQMSLDRFAQAIDLLHAVRQREPEHATAKLFLRNSYLGRTAAQDRLGRHPEAVQDWDQAIRLIDKPTPPIYRALRALALARTDDRPKAIREAEQLASFANLPPPILNVLIRTYAVAARGTAQQATRPLPEREKQAEQCAIAAMALLERARRAGLFAQEGSAERLVQEPDLSILRDRADFRRFLVRLGGLKTL